MDTANWEKHLTGQRLKVNCCSACFVNYSLTMYGYAARWYSGASQTGFKDGFHTVEDAKQWVESEVSKVVLERLDCDG
jgi:hypothetical protein